jgi:hypothetical protein
MLRPAVEAEDDVIPRPSFGVVKLKPPSPDPVVRHPIDLRKLAHQPTG